MQKLEEPRKAQVTVTIDIDLIEIIDNIRGHKKSRSSWINDAIEYTLLHDNIKICDEELDKTLQNHLNNIRMINNSCNSQRRTAHQQE